MTKDYMQGWKDCFELLLKEDLKKMASLPWGSGPWATTLSIDSSVGELYAEYSDKLQRLTKITDN